MSTAEAWTVGRLLTWTADYLKKHGSTSPRLDAEVLLAHARGCQRIELYTAFTDEPSEKVRAAFKEMVRRRAEGTPVAYLVGSKEFYSLPFEINQDVLIPRPETEHLVVEAIERAKKLAGAGEGRPKPSTAIHASSIQSSPTGPAAIDPVAADPTASDPTAIEPTAIEPVATEPMATEPVTTEPAGAHSSASEPVVAGLADRAGEGIPRGRPSASFAQLRIADVGTGSGIVAIALAKSLAGAQVVGLDISPAALALAARNVTRHGVGQQVTLRESDLLATVADQQFDLIVSNPPYITEAEYAQLPVGVRSYEPRTALVGGPEGTEIIERLLAQAAERLRAGGWLLIEISPMIAARTLALVDRSLWSEPVITKDLAGHARILAVSRL